LSVLAAPPSMDIISDTIIRAIKIATTVAATALQIATISKTSLAGGGLIPGAYDGKDTIPAMLSKGEVVLNPAQQARLGGDNTFKAIGVPGFQAGGRADVLPSQGTLPALPSIAQGSAGIGASIDDVVDIVSGAINTLRIEVVESDIRETSKRVKVIESD